MNTPLVSVVVPVYNGSKYIDTLIECMINQTYKNWELIIVDDQSLDNTISIIGNYLIIDNRIKLIIRDREPKGSVTCRNIGLELVRGTYFIQIDADDMISNSFLNDRVNFMEENLDCDYATFRACSVNIHCNKMYNTGKVWGVKRSDDILSDFLKTKYPFSIWNNIYRTQVFKNEKWDENVKIYTDFSYAVPIILKKYRHKFSEKEEFDYFYKVGMQNSMCSNFISNEKYESTKYLFNKTFRQIEVLHNSKKYKKDFLRFFILQFTRLLTDGNKEQKEDFIGFTSQYYGIANIFKMKFVNSLCDKTKNDNEKIRMQIVNLYIALFYYPERIVHSLNHKFSRFRKEKIINNT